jgi:hypothetical protein
MTARHARKSNAEAEIRTRTPSRATDPKSATPPSNGHVARGTPSTVVHRIPTNRTASITAHVTRFRFQFRAARRCRYEQCYRLFTATARDLVFCSARCGRAARGYDESGKRLARGAA